MSPISWDVFKREFIDRFFPREKREAKVEEFINLRQEGMSVLEYSLKFIKFSKYAPSLVFDPRDQMSCFVTGVSEDLQEKCHLAMLNDNMSISRLMVHARRVDEARDKRKSRDGKREKSFDGGSSKNRLEIQDKPRIKKLVSNQVPSNLPKASVDMVSKTKFKKGKGTN